MEERNVDAVVVGGGPAGLSATLWLARYRRSVLLLDGGSYRNHSVELVHGYLGSDPTPPDVLREKARRDLERYPYVTIEQADVPSIDRRGDLFVVHASTGAVLARRIVLCTGVRDEVPEIEGFDEHYGKTVFHCPTCDGYEARGRRVAVLGSRPEVAAFALGMLDWAQSVAVVTGGAPLEVSSSVGELLASEPVRVVEEKASALVGEPGHLEGLRLADGTTIDCDMVFFTIGHHPRSELAVALGCETDEDGYIRIDEQGLTCIPGVYAAGDVTPGLQLVQVAAAQGTAAGVACAQSLRGELGAPTSPRPAPDPGSLDDGDEGAGLHWSAGGDR
ncbi:MAG TPA: NAD(P)/FAD-dependent oxidoreductase [Actinomycetota bacterium]|nr:NAD(P)/FAD-dependent oxidoreductase [Actinomycetota bacterium]